jgi:hypothetical protein
MTWTQGEIRLYSSFIHSFSEIAPSSMMDAKARKTLHRYILNNETFYPKKEKMVRHYTVYQTASSKVAR